MTVRGLRGTRSMTVDLMENRAIKWWVERVRSAIELS